MNIESIIRKIPPLQANEVHVWRIELGAARTESAWCNSILSLDEQERAGRFVFEEDRHEYCYSHAVLRVLLESYGVGSAKEITFRIGERGKPELDHGHRLQFNLAHTRGIAVCAFAYDRPVGIDVERLRVVNDEDEIVQRYFAPEEQAEYSAVVASLRPQAFINAWTRKEAFLKALGVGLGRPLNSFAVTLDPQQPARLVQIDGIAAAAAEWTLQDLTVVAETIIALATPGTNLRILCNDWHD